MIISRRQCAAAIRKIRKLPVSGGLMIPYFFGESVDSRILLLICFIASFVGTIGMSALLKERLPRDGGREFAVGGEKSKGKPRGAGIIFILVFSLISLLLLPVDTESVIYLIMVICAMLSGFLDDASSHPWGRLKKGLLDFLLAGICTGTYLNFNGSSFRFLPNGAVIELHSALFASLAILLIFAAINVVNCTDGVDGLSATVAIVSLLSFYVVFRSLENTLYGAFTISFLLSLLGYLWFNASPSKLLMGDAGSRAIGLLLALLCLKCGMPFLFLSFCLVFLLDGGLGLLKITLIKLLHRPVLMKIRTPLHDHARKVFGWSDTQTVFRFTIIQGSVSALTIYLLFFY